jgi:hypothetical protein
MNVESFRRCYEGGITVPEGDTLPRVLGIPEEAFFSRYPQGLRQVAVAWNADDRHIEREYSLPFQAEVLPDRSGVIVLEPTRDGSGTIVVVNADGSERYRLGVPNPTSRPDWSVRRSFLWIESGNEAVGVVVGVEAGSDFLYELDYDVGRFGSFRQTK